MSGGFEDLGLLPELVKATRDLGWNLPTAVQDETIPLILGGGDVMVAAETGSGKTATFCLPMIQCVHERLRSQAEKSLTDSTAAETIDSSSAKPTSLQIRMNESDKDAVFELLEGGYACFAGGKSWSGGRATHGVRSGKYYYECLVQGDGIARLGWSTRAAHYELGKDAHGYGFGGTGMKSNAGKFEAFGEKYQDGDVIGCFIHLDGDTGRVSYSKNGKFLGTAFELTGHAAKAVYYPAVLLKNAGVRVNFGDSALRFDPTTTDGGCPGEYTSLSSARAEHIVSSVESSSAGVSPSSSSSGRSAGAARKPVALIIEPARELAEQVHKDCNDFLRYITDPKLSSMLLVGGRGGAAEDSKVQVAQLQGNGGKGSSGGVDIVIGTPGKLEDFVKRGFLDLSHIKFFILDEADRFASDKEALEIILSLFRKCPSGGIGVNRLQVCFFSATLHSTEIGDLSNKICSNPTWVDLKGVDAVPETVHHVVYRLDLVRDLSLKTKGTVAQHAFVNSVTDEVHTKEEARVGGDPANINSQLVKELKQFALLKIIDKFQMSQCLIFCRTNVDCNNLETFLTTCGGGRKFNARAETGKENPYSCCVLAGMRSNDERKQSLDAFREGRVRFLICTDVAARGLDIKSLPYVINMTLPDEAENYIHRIGRVGRADKMGLALSIVAPVNVKEKVWYHKCANRGRDCTNRRLIDSGGCTIWYDETQLLLAVEARLKHSIASLVPSTFELPPELLKADGTAVAYGELPDTNSSSSAMLVGGKTAHSAQLERLQELQPTVKELAILEHTAQNNFLSMQQFHCNKKPK